MRSRVCFFVGIVTLTTTVMVLASVDNPSKILGVWELIEPKVSDAKFEFGLKGMLKVTVKNLGEFQGTYRVMEDKVAIVYDSTGDKSETQVLIIKKLTDDELHLEKSDGRLQKYKRCK